MQYLDSVRWILATFLPLFRPYSITNPSTSVSFAATEFDVIIVGGGTAGLVVANRLSAPRSLDTTPLRVGVIDAGWSASEGDPLIDIPYGANIFLGNSSASTVGNPKYDWMYQTVPQPALDGRIIGYPRGKVLGGSSALHAMAWQRGSRTDYDAWGASFGNGDDWTFDALLPFFKRSENWTALTSATTSDTLLTKPAEYGQHGPLSISYNSYVSGVDDALMKSSATMGYPFNDAPDSGIMNYLPRAGIPRTLDTQSGKRAYAASAYLNEEVKMRPNLVILTNATASAIVFDDTVDRAGLMARGVQYIVDGKTYTATATREIILSAGSLKTPQLLELSGIGNASLLRSLDIPVKLDLPGIGENLMDHPVSISDFKVKDHVETLDGLTFNETYLAKHKQLYYASHTGAFTYTPSITGGWPCKDILTSEKYARMRSQLNSALYRTPLTPLQRAQYDVMKKVLLRDDVPCFMPAVVPHGAMASLPQPNTSYITIIGFQLHQFSRGTVHINNSDPMSPPLINNAFLSIPWDLDLQVEGMRFIRKWVSAEPVASLIDELVTPPAELEDPDEWASWIKSTVWSMAHPMGTTAMASRELGGVVDPRLKVYGTQNVRIIDAGVIPMTVGAPIQAAVYALAEKGSEIIRQDLLGFEKSQGVEQISKRTDEL